MTAFYRHAFDATERPERPHMARVRGRAPPSARQTRRRGSNRGLAPGFSALQSFSRPGRRSAASFGIARVRDQAFKCVNRERGSSFLKSRSKLTRCSPSWSTAAASQASGRSLPDSCLSRHNCRTLAHSGPRGANSTPGAASMASTKASASAVPMLPDGTEQHQSGPGLHRARRAAGRRDKAQGTGTAVRRTSSALPGRPNR